MEFSHVSVLLEETIANVLTDPKGVYVDCTLGGAGHALALGQRLDPEGMIIGLDQDDDALRVASERLKTLSCRTMTIKTNFKDLKDALIKHGIHEVHGFIFDLGVSSYQLDTAERGFSYMHDGPLDMRMDQNRPLRAQDLVNTASPEELRRIITEYGEERWAKRIVDFIVEARAEKDLTTTGELVQLIKKAIPAAARREGPHPAKRTFQALRIAVNDELGILQRAFTDAVSLLVPGGRLGVITFHSLEDRITKQCFQKMRQGCTCPPELPLCVCENHPLVKGKNKAIEPSETEVVDNPRARSAKLRVVEKI